MSDNIPVNQGTESNAVTVATDDIGGTHYPIYKMSYGADGSQTPVDGTNPLPVSMIEQSAEGYIQNDAIVSALDRVLKELKIMNIHLSMITDNEISKAEIES